MKKLFCLFLLLLLCACAEKREVFPVLGIDDNDLAVGYDDVTHLESLGFSFERAGTMEGYSSSRVYDLYYGEENVGEVSYANLTKKEIESENATVTYIDLYVKALGRPLAFEGEEVPMSIKETCERAKGDYFYQNGYACIIERSTKKRYITIILHGDISAVDQDEIDRIEIIAE